MSPNDTMVRLLSARSLDLTGHPLPVQALPGLQPEAIQQLESSNPEAANASLRELLQVSCGLTGTPLGDIDFTGRWHPEEPLAIFRPCLSLAVDDGGRRWIAEVTDGSDLPGPVWCIFREPAVAVYVSDDLAEFVSKLRDRMRCGRVREWVRSLSAEARVIWTHGRALGARSRNSLVRDQHLRSWIAALPPDTYVYDLRAPNITRGYPYALAGPSSRIYRCGRLPVFAVSAWPACDGGMPRGDVAAFLTRSLHSGRAAMVPGTV